MYKLVLQGAGFELSNDSQNVEGISSINIESSIQPKILIKDNNNNLSDLPIEDLPIITGLTHLSENIEEAIHTDLEVKRHSLDLRMFWGRKNGELNLLTEGKGIFGEILIDEVPNWDNCALIAYGLGDEICSNINEVIILGLLICESEEELNFYNNLDGFDFDISWMKEELGADSIPTNSPSESKEILNSILSKVHFWNKSDINIEGSITRF